MSPDTNVPMMLRALGLPSMLAQYEPLATQAEQQSWSLVQYLQQLCEVELAGRHTRRIQRLLTAAHLPEGKTLAMLDERQLPLKVRRQLATLLEGDFVKRAENVLAFGLPGRGKTHLMCALARELIVRHGYRVSFLSTFALVQQLLIAKRDLRLEALLRQLDRCEVIVLDDLGYVQQSREEMEVLFTFLAERYERRSLLITSNLVFSEWDKIFKDPMTTAAAIDRLVHHAIILELSGESYRAKHARERKETAKEKS
jgi:DNA replication protein DnaC